jgi:chromosome segregation ATPase
MVTTAPQASVSDRVNRAPRTQNYNDLEAYETTDYRVRGEIRALDSLCTELENLKDDSEIDFRRLQVTRNRCVAEFFVTEADVGRVRDTVTKYPVALTRITESVSAYRSDLIGRAEIVRQQLREVETLLAEANERYDTLARFAQEQGDAQALTQTVDDQLNTLDSLTQRRISLTEQLQQLEKSKANLQDRINRVRFSVNVSRLIPQQPNEDTARWAVAWDDLTDRLTEVQIGLTAYFAIFILYTLQYAFYGVVAIIALRLLWKFIRFVWRY